MGAVNQNQVFAGESGATSSSSRRDYRIGPAELARRRDPIPGAVHWNIRAAGAEAGNHLGYATANEAMRRALAGHMRVVYDRELATTSLCFSHPMSFRPLEGKRNVLLTMFESEIMPPEYRQALELADLLVVPSEFCRRVFSSRDPEGNPPPYSRRIELCPLGFDPRRFSYRPRPPVDPARGRPFRWLYLGAPNPRKWSILEDWWRGFLWPFAQRGEAELYCKVTGADLEGGLGELAAAGTELELEEHPEGTIVRGTGRHRGWTVDNRRLAADQVPELYATAHGFVALHMGEGWGLGPLEAIAQGIPTLVTDYSGTREFATAETAYPVRCQVGRIPCETLAGQRVFVHAALPDINHAAALAFEIMSGYKRAREKGRAAAEAAKRFTWAHAAKRLRSILEPGR